MQFVVNGTPREVDVEEDMPLRNLQAQPSGYTPEPRISEFSCLPVFRSYRSVICAPAEQIIPPGGKIGTPRPRSNSKVLRKF